MAGGIDVSRVLSSSDAMVLLLLPLGFHLGDQAWLGCHRRLEAGCDLRRDEGRGVFWLPVPSP
jgi:hypothetical protein